MDAVNIEKESDRFMCLSCGANMAFDPKLESSVALSVAQLKRY